MNQMPRNAGGVEPYTAHIPQGGWFAAWSNFTAQVKTSLARFLKLFSCARCQWFTKTGSGQTYISFGDKRGIRFCRRTETCRTVS